MKAELISCLGDDLTVVNSARVSFDKESDWKKNTLTGKELHDKDKKLISYLAKNNHFTPFTHCSITLREEVPIFVARQRFKHTIGFTYNEVSRRYVDDDPKFYIPDEWRGKSEDAKQGSSNTIIDVNPTLGNGKKLLVDNYKAAIDNCLWTYDYLLHIGVCPEQARMVLPQSTYTSYYVTGSLAAFARAYKLRSSFDAQKEIRDLADKWNNIISVLYPESWKALTTKVNEKVIH
jgi:thymidylate synthase (FAD)